MNIKISIKQLGKKRNKITECPFFLAHKPTNVKELITECVITCVNAYNQRWEQKDNVTPITSEEIETMSEIGKIAFGVNYGNRKANLSEAIDTAILAYEDGLVRIFINERELQSLEETIDLTQDDVCTFIKLTMLSGSFF